MKTLGTILLTVLLIACANTAQSQSVFRAAELDTALSYLGMTEADFVSDRVWMDDDTFLLPQIRTALQSPISAYGIARNFSNAAPGSVAEAGRINDLAQFIDAGCPQEACRQIDAELAAAKPPIADPFEPLLTAFNIAESYRVQAFAKLSPAEQAALIASASAWFEDKDNRADDSLKGLIPRAFGQMLDTTKQIESDSILTLLSRVDRKALSAATYAFARGLALTTQAWKTTKPPFSITTVQGSDGLILASRETPFGTFVLGGSGPNTYTGDFALILDMGGDDRYLCRAGGAVPGLGHAISAVLDFGGNDFYRSNKSVDQGAGILGLGALVDLGGDDEFIGKSFVQGAAFCGAGLFFDNGGMNTLRADIFAQAAAVCGVSVLAAGDGRNIFDLGEYGQACAFTFAAAVLVGGNGNDVYRSGGLASDAPLRPEDFGSFSQGFAIGSRPRGGGGIAVLHDKGGNDFYNGEIYAQGVGYWYSLGALIDDAGNDVYNATQYAQGAGIHLAAGVLEDGGGDDRYGSRFGPGQGGAHDLAVAMFYDHNGDDQYTMSGGQGMAITNSAALFFDGAGNDMYNTVEPGLGQGGVRDMRGFGNLGVFLDGEGHDFYAQSGRADSSLWLQGLFGLGYDVDRDSLRPREAQPPDTLIASDTLRSIPDLFRDASRWEVTDNRALVRRSRKALAAKGMTAVHWVAANKLNTLEGLEQRAIVDLFKTAADSSAQYLYAAMNSTDPTTRRNAIRIFGDMKYKKAAKAFTEKLHDSAYTRQWPALLSAMGDLGDKDASQTALEFAASSSERERLNAMVCLGKLGDSRSYDALLKGLGDPLYSVRSAAIIALAQQGPSVVSALQKDLPEEDIRQTEALLLATAQLAHRWNSADSLRKNTEKLSSVIRNYTDRTEPRIQGAVYLAASEIYDSKDLQKLKDKFVLTKNPVVLARIRQAEQKIK
jgi:HEAT repeat protein